MASLGGQDTTRVLQEILTGRRVATPALGAAPLEAVVVSATATQVVVTVTGFSTVAAWTCSYEPRWAWNSTTGQNVQQIPPAGTKCLIVLPANTATSTPWVLAFTGWPAG